MQPLRNPEEAARWLKARVTGTLCADSRQIRPGDGFIAWPGAATDGRKFVAAALAAGAGACLIERQGAQAYGFIDPRIATYNDLKADTGPIAAAYFGAPSQELNLFAVTGTNGKTSTACWLAQALAKVGRRCGVIGTLGIGEPGAMLVNGLTTPDPVLLQQQLRRFADEGFSACAIEASSIGLQEHRLDALHIDVAIFTNFTQDHLDYHASMDDYWRAKAALFHWPGLTAAIVNLDDAKGVELSAALQGGPDGKSLDVWTFSCEQPARLRADAIVHGAQGLRFDVQESVQESVQEGAQDQHSDPSDHSYPLTTGLVGQYNVSNLLGVIAALRAVGVPLAQAVDACTGLQPVPGRTEMLAVDGQPLVIIDYAHTPDALEKVLAALKPVARARGGQLRCVFGCGGDRDASKRPLMAAAAEKNADQLILTSDNPRSENPLTILAQMLPGLSRLDAAQLVPDRAAAIAQAIAQAQPQDVVLLAGKGHENYQEINGVKHSFSDRTQAQIALGMMNLQQVQHWLPAARLVGEGALAVARVHTDSRSLQAGDLFVALKGERFDAHDFLPQAKAQGAVAAIAECGLDAAGLPGLEVADSRLALGQLAAGWRSQFSLPLIAVTGSNGKTTVTQMIAAILRAYKPEAAFATEGNLNNDIGVPLTLLRLRATHEVGVVELGMNHPGEIAYLADLARPTVALVNNAQREHLEFMQTVQAVAQENGSVLSALPGEGVAVFPADDAFTPLWRELAGSRKVLTFALVGPADVTAQAHWNGQGWQVSANTPAGALDFALHIAGRHNVKNALAATACALAAGVPLTAIALGLSGFAPVKGRSRAVALTLAGRAITLIDDTYNANPDSMRAAIDVLAELPGPRLLVMGDMGEVGDQGPQFHAEAGGYAAQAGIEQLFALGEQSRAAAAAAFGAARHFNDMAELLAAVAFELPHVASVLVKGSRFMKMERVVDAVATAAQLAQPIQQPLLKAFHAA